MKPFLTIALLACAVVSNGQTNSQTKTPATADGQAVIRSSSQEVLLDVIVRDKKMKLLKDLTAKDFEISDDGQKQTVKSFRLISGPEVVASSAGNEPAPTTGARPVITLDPIRQIRIVTLVFDQLGSADSRNNARTAVNDLLKNEAGNNLFFAVFSIDQGLSILQQYTSDKELIRKAVAKVTSGASALYKSESARIEEEVKTVATQDAANATVATPAAAPPDAGALVSVALAKLTLNMMQFSQTMDRTLQGRSTLYALESLITQQFRLPGRKTLLFFSEGFQVPPDYVEEFQALISTANRANVSVYGIDARGLNSGSQNGEGGSMLSQAVSGSRTQQARTGGPVTRDQATAVDRSMEAIQANSLNSLDEISQKTGGFLVANTNDLRSGLHRITEEVETHYELSYSPDIKNFDGHFRKISVSVNRPDAKVQTRSGYFALPFLPGENLLSYEMVMLNALSSNTPPLDIAYRSTGMHFRSPQGEPEGVVVLDVPLQGIEFTKDDAKKTYQTHFSVLALVKDEQGAIVKKFSQDIPRQGPLDKIDAFKAGHFIYSQHAALAPGRYILETAVTDRTSGKVAAAKSSIVVPSPAESPSMSSLVRVRSFTPKTAADQNASEDPFDVSTGKVSPGLDEAIKGGAGQVLSYFFTVYVPAGTQKAPDLVMEFYKDGQLLGRGGPQLPAPDKNGVIPYIASVPLDSFKPGKYELKVIVSQNGKAAGEKAQFTIE